MDRIAVLAPPTNTNRTFSPVITIPILVVAASALVQVRDGSDNSYAQQYHLSLIAIIIDVTILACIIYIISSEISLRRRKLVEAAVEITPLGVQLVSIYGTTSDSFATNRKRNQVKIRTFIPREQIKDVIVMEIVWPHCVWSQLAFRVIKNTPAKERFSNDNEMKCPCVHHKSGSKIFNVNELYQHYVISIIPCFPEECRGLLTYEQCLTVQVEIERLIGLPMNK